jgi:uncharacterized protein YbjT (DUF2867 family)
MVRSIALALFAIEGCPAEECMRIAVTGAYGFSGRYIARRLLDSGHEVITLTNSPDRKNPFGKRVQAFRYNFSRPAELEESLRDVDILINNYWVRFDNPPQFTFVKAIANSKVLLDAAKRAGVRRVVHISITNPERKSDLPYFSGKAEVEAHLQSTGMSYSILRPALLFGEEDILINNIAWTLRYLPVFGLYGDGQYRLQPIYVDDLAAAVVQRISQGSNETTDAIGPEIFRYCDLVEMIARKIGSWALIVPMPPMVAYQSMRVLGWFVDDVISTEEEVRGLMQERLYVESPPLGRTKLSDWVEDFRHRLGRHYASEMWRRTDRVSSYR